MRDLQEYIYEASLLGDVDGVIDGALSDINAEFEGLKSQITDYKNYKIDKGHAWGNETHYLLYLYNFEYENLINYVRSDLKNCNNIKVDIKKYKRTAHSNDLANGCFGFRLHFCDSHYSIVDSTEILYISIKQCKTFQSFINKIIKPIFKDLESFKKFIEEYKK